VICTDSAWPVAPVLTVSYSADRLTAAGIPRERLADASHMLEDALDAPKKHPACQDRDLQIAPVPTARPQAGAENGRRIRDGLRATAASSNPQAALSRPTNARNAHLFMLRSYLARMNARII